MNGLDPRLVGQAIEQIRSAARDLACVESDADPGAVALNDQGTAMVRDFYDELGLALAPAAVRAAFLAGFVMGCAIGLEEGDTDGAALRLLVLADLDAYVPEVVA